MDVQFGNRIRVSTPTVGTGTLALGSAIGGMQPFLGTITSGSTVSYTIEDGPLAFEVGSGVYTTGTLGSPDTLTRNVEVSSAGGTALLHLSGSATVYVTPTAGWLNNMQTQFLRLTGGTVIGSVTVEGTATFGSTVTLHSNPVAALEACTKGYADALAGVFVSGDPRNMQAIPKQYADGLPFSGGIPEAPLDGKFYGRENGAWVTMPPATTSVLGAVIPDGTTVLVTTGGVISSLGGGAGGAVPANIGAPSVTPTTATIGALLTCAPGTWTNTPLGYNYQWQHNSVNIVGATSATYVVQSTDAGGPVTCNVVAVNSAGVSLPATSNAISVVGPPTNTVLPSIIGANTVGTTLTCAPGTWTNSPTFAYQWTREVTNISGATSATYTLVSGDASHQIGCIVTATNGSGSNSATAPPILIQGPPVNTVAATISGTALIKQILTVTNNGTWLGAPTFTYQWQRNGVDIAGASGVSYETIYIDGGTTITCNVTGHNSFGTATGASNGIAVAVPYSFPAGATGIYSTRLAVAAYGLTGKCVKVTRLSDNATLDIGFNQFGDLDIASALGFAGGATLSVGTWYDQSGNGNDLTQPTIIGSQPELLNVSGQPYLAFNLTSDISHLVSAAPIGLTGDQTIGGVFQLATPAPGAAAIVCWDATNGGWYLDFNGAGHGSSGYFSTGGGELYDPTNLLAGSVHRVGMTRTSGTVALWVDGVQTVTSGGHTNIASTSPMWVGGQPGSPALAYEGLIGEIYIYPSAQSLTPIHTSEAAYFPATGFQNYYNGAHAFQPSAHTELSFGNVLRYEYTQPWTLFAAIQLYSHNGEQAEAALWSNIFHGGTYIGYLVAVVLNPTGGSPFAKGAINCRMIHSLGGPITAITVCGSTDVVDGRPHLIAVSWDGSGVAAGFKIYIDGVLETVTTIVYDSLGGNTILDPRTDGFQQIVETGMQVNDNGNQIKGRLGFLQVDKTVRNQAYITSNFSTTNPGPPPNDATAGTGTVFRLLFNEGSGALVHDTGAIGTSLVGTITTFSSGSEWVP